MMHGQKNTKLGCARVQMEDRFFTPLMAARNGVLLYLYFAFITFCFSTYYHPANSLWDTCKLIEQFLKENSHRSRCFSHKESLRLRKKMLFLAY